MNTHTNNARASHLRKVPQVVASDNYRRPGQSHNLAAAPQVSPTLNEVLSLLKNLEAVA